jgi:hypothetical protein
MQGWWVSMPGLFSTCFFVNATSNRLAVHFVWTTEIGEISTCRPPSQPPVSTVR